VKLFHSTEPTAFSNSQNVVTSFTEDGYGFSDRANHNYRRFSIANGVYNFYLVDQRINSTSDIIFKFENLKPFHYYVSESG
jgi:hypothetical protein